MNMQPKAAILLAASTLLACAIGARAEDDAFTKAAKPIVQAAVEQFKTDLDAALDTYEKGVRGTLMKQFPNDPRPVAMLLEIALNRNVSDNKLAAVPDKLDKLRTLLTEITQSAVAAQSTKTLARTQLARLDRLGKPLTLKFDSFETKDQGARTIDVAKLKGQVVLINFWATWSPPCLAELDNLKKIYQEKHNPAGDANPQFEIVGISLDRNVNRLERFLKELQIQWPQHCDSRGMENEFAVEYAIHTVPTMWLIDKQGNLRDLNARINLEKKIQLLLDEKPVSEPEPDNAK